MKALIDIRNCRVEDVEVGDIIALSNDPRNWIHVQEIETWKGNGNRKFKSTEGKLTSAQELNSIVQIQVRYDVRGAE